MLWDISASVKSMPRRVGCIILAPLGVGGSGRGREGGRVNVRDRSLMKVSVVQMAWAAESQCLR